MDSTKDCLFAKVGCSAASAATRGFAFLARGPSAWHCEEFASVFADCSQNKRELLSSACVEIKSIFVIVNGYFTKIVKCFCCRKSSYKLKTYTFVFFFTSRILLLELFSTADRLQAHTSTCRWLCAALVDIKLDMISSVTSRPSWLGSRILICHQMFGNGQPFPPLKIKC